MKEQERIEVKEKAQRMHERKFGIRPPLDLDEPCFDMDKKEFIIRNDVEAE